MDLRGVHEWYLGLQRHVMTSAHLQALRPLFQNAPNSADFRVVRQFHDRLITQALFNQQLNDAIAIAIDDYAAKRLRVPKDKRLKDETSNTDDAFGTLMERGWCELPPIESETCDAIEESVGGLNVYEGFTREKEEPMPLDEARGRFNIVNYKDTHLILQPEIVRFASDPSALAVVRRYLRAPPILSTIQCWWSFGGHDAQHAQLFHLDLDDYRFIKLFLYLTDVTEENGPHAFIEKTHDPGYVQKCAAECADGESTFVDWYMQTLRKSDEDVARFFPQPTTLITGKRGKRFLALTRAIHKGLAPNTGERLLLQATYCVSPYVQREPAPRKISDAAARHLPRDCMRPPLDYLFQLYLER